MITAAAWVRANCKFASDFSYDGAIKDLWSEIIGEAQDEFGISFDTENDNDITNPFDVKGDDYKVTCQAFAAGGDWQTPVLYYRCQVRDGYIYEGGHTRSEYTMPHFAFIPGKKDGNPALEKTKRGDGLIAHNQLDEEGEECSERLGRKALKKYLSDCRKQYLDKSTSERERGSHENPDD